MATGRRRGARIKRELAKTYTMEPWQLHILEEVARTADRLDQLQDVFEGKSLDELLHVDWATELEEDHGVLQVNISVTVDTVWSEIRLTENLFKQLLVSLRLPDEVGKQPQGRNQRGAYQKGETEAAPGEAALGHLRGITGGQSA